MGERPTGPGLGEDLHNRDIRRLYDRRAPFYDFIVRALSLGRDGRYRDRAVAALGATPGMRILDVGCGTGLNFSKLPRGAVGAEPSAALLRIARRRTSSLVCSFSESLPFRDHAFDRVLSTYVITTVPRWKDALSEMTRVLKPGGRMVLTDDRLPPRWFLGPGPMFRKLLRDGWVDVHQDVVAQMRSAFREVRVEYLHFGMIFLLAGMKR